MENFTKVICFGTLPTYRGRPMSVFCKITYTDGKLSITGVEGPLSSGDALGSCGQIDMHLREPKGLDGLVLAPGWTLEMVQRFLDVWDTWHLNDMQAGTPAQTAELKKHTFPGYPVSHYDWACDVLAKAGLHPDNGYKYGSAWLKVEVPADVLEFLKSLPDTDKTPAWV